MFGKVDGCSPRQSQITGRLPLAWPTNPCTLYPLYTYGLGVHGNGWKPRNGLSACVSLCLFALARRKCPVPLGRLRSN